MTERQLCYPLELHLPDGVIATLIIGSAADGQPRYAINGVVSDIDVRIPPDLARTWMWHGGRLVQREPGGMFIIYPWLYPPPGYRSSGETCFDVARSIGVWILRQR